ncbi:Synaptobrevin family protein [Trichomonas vaginalis G3]|uniref:Synaptobrevin family protein n=1 Tax=Trichomonas vaginalis (strain ATCC PRA-98 / G3) TaxID=412133 RepID=A2F4D1_TRIV3|nr:SNAP receptor protein [Trichomonas vaginalis G3]EAY00251.1 Synaptobrevin family protein [Trichomonas vaginalis G3]KAI5536806.1 SNAP receptor protein [Trichomonas vaginalis G3]|eukprot:XP_001313180.1 Synaptobrevin family protein [Trichomonas vaginalis G3]
MSNSNNNINYAAVCRGNTILAQAAITSGNFDSAIVDIIGKMDPNQSQVMTEKGQYRYFVIHDQQGLNFIAAGATSVQAKLAFEFLENVQKRFNLQYARMWRIVPAYGMQQEFGSQIQSLITSTNNDKIRTIKSNIAATQETMTEAMQNALLRGDKIETMNEKAEVMAANAKEYERSATRVKRKMCWERYRWYLIGIVCVIVLILIIVLIACKGFKCSHSSTTPTPTPIPPTPTTTPNLQP